MKRLAVIYDDSCGFCVRCRWWLARQPAFFEFVFVPRSSAALARLFPGLQLGSVGGGRERAPRGPAAAAVTNAELIVVGETGQVYRDDAAFIMCLYGLREYREWALRLGNPALMPLAARFFRAVSKRRSWLSRVFGASTDRQLDTLIEQGRSEVCETCHP